MTTRIASVSATFASWRMSRTASGGTASRRNPNSKRAVTSHSFIVGRLPSATSWTRLPEKMCVVQIATTGPTMTATTSNGFKATQPS